MENYRTNLFFTAILGLLAMCGSALAQWTEPVTVTEINTEYMENTPFLSYDGLTIYFARADTPDFYWHRIYQATREVPDGPFTSVEEISALNSSGGHVLSPWVSPDNLRMYYYRTELGSVGRIQISHRASVDDPWPLGSNISELNSLGDIRGMSLTADELTIVFRANISGGQGGYDVWMATRPDKNLPFGNVTNLTEVNSSANDNDPFISPDGLSLYFSSDRNGNGQLFRANRPSLDAPFSAPEHLSFFDSPGSSLGAPCLSSDGTAFYFTKWPDGEDLDIYVSYLVPREIAIDIKPTSCPNPLNLQSWGVLPVAILGLEDFDVNAIDIASIRLAGVAPIRSSYEDVAAPVSDGNECECTTAGPDGYTDLTLKFKTQKIVEQLVNALGELVDGEVLLLTLTGALHDGTPIEGTDCVVVLGKVPKPIAAKRSDINADGIVNILDLGMIAKYWLESNIVQD